MQHQFQRTCSVCCKFLLDSLQWNYLSRYETARESRMTYGTWRRCTFYYLRWSIRKLKKIINMYNKCWLCCQHLLVLLFRITCTAHAANFIETPITGATATDGQMRQSSPHTPFLPFRISGLSFQTMRTLCATEWTIPYHKVQIDGSRRLLVCVRERSFFFTSSKTFFLIHSHSPTIDC